ncbi:tyrosine-type recombinase/integrase [Roseibium alexandrii]|uniref:Putative prophage CPS-53 integrase n=1 Tax=Roseibium alexandrii TaxID=388408 RepID=A0A0M7A7E7_9HYPH|nr:integrase arm-type DNA-binding domain-containing protein [Roseibium alexandrii]CTQ69653.1 Putative prophage CPS-53 integrase [Roseibium alexandrii]
MLTDTAIRKAQTREKPYKMADKNGLYILVKPNGSKLFRYDYKVHGRRRTQSFGQYPKTTLKMAREQHQTSWDLVAKGLDPMASKLKAGDPDFETDTFGALVADYIANLKAEKRAEATLNKNRWLLQDLAKTLHDKPVRSIKASDILPVIQSVERQGKIESAQRLRGIIGSVFRFGVARGRADDDPAQALRGAIRTKKVRHHPAIVEEKQLGRLLRSIWAYEGSATIAAALKISAYCYARPVETRYCRWDHLDLQEAIWTVPADLKKMRVVHDIPLCKQAVQVFREMHEIRQSDFVFYQLRKPDRPISENAMNSALANMGYKDIHTSHGFRASAGSILTKHKYADKVIELSLSHLEKDETRRAYRRYEFWDERVEMAQGWADLCDNLRSRKLHELI